MTLDRREFLQTTALSGLAAAVGAAPLAAATPPSRRPTVPAFDLDEITIDQLQDGMRPGAYTSRSLCEKYLARVETIDRPGPTPRAATPGTGSAIAANLAPVGVGTETDGSVVCPSSAAALVGIKPTLGLVSRRGIVPIAHSQDTAGPMARTVRDAAILLGVLAGADTEDAITATGPGISDYTRFLDPNGLKGAN